jgi:hypothetical protein
MRLFVGADLDRVAGFHREGSVRRNGVVEDRTGEHCRGRQGEARKYVASGPATDTTENEQGNGRSDPSELAVASSSPREEVRNLEARRYGPAGLCAESSAQHLSLLGILRPPLPLLRMRGKIRVDHLGALGRQATIDPDL